VIFFGATHVVGFFISKAARPTSPTRSGTGLHLTHHAFDDVILFVLGMFIDWSASCC